MATKEATEQAKAAAEAAKADEVAAVAAADAGAAPTDAATPITGVLSDAHTEAAQQAQQLPPPPADITVVTGVQTVGDVPAASDKPFQVLHSQVGKHARSTSPYASAEDLGITADDPNALAKLERLVRLGAIALRDDAPAAAE